MDRNTARGQAAANSPGILTLARARRILAKHPEWRTSLKGDLQMHTQWSDGAGTVAEMAFAAMEQGYEYIGITDHTQDLKIANGLDESRLREQGTEVAALNRDLKKRRIAFTVLRSAEMNFSPTGEGDATPSTLAKLDLVLGCFHSALRKPEDQRGCSAQGLSVYIAGLRNPAIQILGHPQTRV